MRRDCHLPSRSAKHRCMRGRTSASLPAESLDQEEELCDAADSERRGLIGSPGAGLVSTRQAALKFKVFVWEYPNAQHVARARLNHMLRQEPCCKIGGGFPHAWIQTRIAVGKLRPQPYLSDPAVQLHANTPLLG